MEGWDRLREGKVGGINDRDLVHVLGRISALIWENHNKLRIHTLTLALGGTARVGNKEDFSRLYLRGFDSHDGVACYVNLKVLSCGAMRMCSSRSHSFTGKACDDGMEFMGTRSPSPQS